MCKASCLVIPWSGLYNRVVCKYATLNPWPILKTAKRHVNILTCLDPSLRQEADVLGSGAVEQRNTGLASLSLLFRCSVPLQWWRLVAESNSRSQQARTHSSFWGRAATRVTMFQSLSNAMLHCTHATSHSTGGFVCEFCVDFEIARAQLRKVHRLAMRTAFPLTLP